MSNSLNELSSLGFTVLMLEELKGTTTPTTTPTHLHPHPLTLSLSHTHTHRVPYNSPEVCFLL